MKKAVVVGSSIAGATAAYLLADSFDVKVYDAKERKKIGDKLCGNLCTDLFLKSLNRIGINGKQFIKSKFTKAVFHSPSNKLVLWTKEYCIDRGKFVEHMIKQAEKKGAKFHFGARLEDVSIGKHLRPIFLMKHANIIEQPDHFIGADGAVSSVAKHCWMDKDRKFFLALQAEVNPGEIKNLKFKKGEYHVFVGEKFGHYAYLFPSKLKVKIGIVDDSSEDVKKKFNDFMKHLGIKKRVNVKGALIPRPKVSGSKENISLIGDAGGYQKFSGGGIILAILSAEALRNSLINKSNLNHVALKMIVLQNRFAVWFFGRLKDKSWDEFLELLKKKKYQGLLEKRDLLDFGDLIKFLDPKMMWFGIKSLFRF